jgi:tetratricopeptide (TPR) repeat protein
VIVSYMQAGLTCQYIAGRWGQAGLEAMLDVYGEGKGTVAAIEGALKISPAQFDEDFAKYVDAELGAVVQNFDAWSEAQEEAHGAFQQESWQEAADRASRAIELYPDYVDEGSPYLVKARALRELGDTAAVTTTLLEYRRLGGHDPDALIALARDLAEAQRNDEALAVLEDVLMVAPLRETVHLELGDRLMTAGRAADAAVEYRALLAMKPQDMAEAHFRLAKAYYAGNDRPKSREQLLYALEIAPHYREAQQLLLEIVR